MIVLFLIIFSVIYVLGVFVHFKKSGRLRLTRSERNGLLAVPFCALWFSLISIIAVGSRGVAQYDVTVNKDTYSCERPLVSFDASVVWPGLHVKHYDYTPGAAVCTLQ